MLLHDFLSQSARRFPDKTACVTGDLRSTFADLETGSNRLANALIPEGKVIPERSLVVGSPGRVIRTLTDNEIEHLKWNAQHYVDNARLYEQELCALEPSSVIGAKEA